MKKRKFIGRTAILTRTALFFKQGVSAKTKVLPKQYVAIGNGACNVLDDLKKNIPTLNIMKAPGVDLDFAQSALLGLPVLKGQPISNVVQPLVEAKNYLVVLYCLGGKSNVSGALDFLNQLKQRERKFNLIVQFPFKFEGENRNRLAIQTAKKISSISSYISFNASYLYTNTLSLKDNFRLLNTMMISLMKGEDN